MESVLLVSFFVPLGLPDHPLGKRSPRHTESPVTPAPFTSPLAAELAPGLLERFLNYVRIDTQSARDRVASPSTPGQLELARLLAGELRAAGLADAELDETG